MASNRHLPLLAPCALILAAALNPLHAAETSPDTQRHPHTQDTQAASQQVTPLGTVHVQSSVADGYRAEHASVGGFGLAPIKDTPAAITVITRAELDDRQPRSLSELAYGDASLGDDYAPVGYYQDVTIRGYILDPATGFRLDNLPIVGAQRVALENKQRVEILKGLAGLQAGVVAPAGLINYVSKRPADVHTVTLGTDSHGSRYGTTDLGGWLTPTFGLRFNAAYERTHSYVQHADGRRNFYSLAADWKITPAATLKLDAEYQANAQRDASGYQLLGGTALPPHPDRTRMLGFEPWQQPTSIHALNSNAKFDYHFNHRWQAHMALGHSRAVIDDNVAYAYGCFYVASCAASRAPGYFFAPNGDYDIYDFRSPGDTRRSDTLRADLRGVLQTGPIRHEVTLGVSAFRHTVDQRVAVYDYVGSANIDENNPPYFPPSPNQPGPSARRLTSWQRAAFALDRLHLTPHWQVVAGARFVRLDERAYADTGAPQRHTRLGRTLPQAALLWLPTDNLTAYLTWSKGLSLGAQAPYWTSNSNAFLPPLLSRQAEAGVKYDWGDSLALTASVFRIRQPDQFAMPDATPTGFTFVQRGTEVHTGLELQANGRVSDNLHLTASASWLHSRVHNTGIPAYEGRQLVNMPRLRTSVYLDYRLPFAPRFGVMGGWRYSAPKSALPDGSVRVAAYNLFDAGVRWRTHLAGHSLTWRLSVSNLFDRFYWRDTGTAYGDRFVFPGQPRLARLNLTYDL